MLDKIAWIVWISLASMTAMKVCLLVDVVEDCLPILLNPMFYLAAPSRSSPATVPHMPESFGMHRAAQAHSRHSAQPRPRPVAAEAYGYRSGAH